jgi:tetratricopeptide (TPR) repeat protein
MIQHPPFPGQSNYTSLRDFLDVTLEHVTNEVGTAAEVIERRRDIVNSGDADWKVHFELAVLSQRMRDSSAMYYHLNRILELYPHNRESYLKIADALSRDGKWAEVIPHLERSLHYTRGDEQKIAETKGWLGTAYLRTGDYEQGADLLLDVTADYPDQVGLSIRAYGNLIRYANEHGEDADLERYVDDVQRYARSLIRSGKNEEYPLLNQRMSQILTMGGYTEEAREWAEAEKQ